jgi:predicted  nucleic acid-binding Zn-ribbon protein
MEKKTKLIIISAAGAVLLLLIVAVLILYKSRAVRLEKDRLSNENVSLSQKVEDILNDAKKLKDKTDSLNTDLERLSREKQDLQTQKDEIQKQYDLVLGERDELLKKIGSQPTPSQPVVVIQEAPREAAALPAEEAYWAGILKSKTDLELQLENMRDGLKTAKLDNAELQRDKSSLELDLSSLIRQKQDLEQQLKMIDSMSLELVREKNTAFKLQDDLKSLRAENIMLKRQVKSLRNYRTNVQSKLKKLEEEKAGLERRFTEMEFLLENRLSQTAELRQQLDAIRSGEKVEMSQGEKEAVELPPIVVRPQSGLPISQTTIQGPTMGTILTLNKENNFVIIDLGEDDGIKIGEAFQVYRQDKVIAGIEVIQTRKNIAACDIKREIQAVRVGDTIK